MKRKKLARLFNMSESLNYQLTPKPCLPCLVSQEAVGDVFMPPNSAPRCLCGQESRRNAGMATRARWPGSLERMVRPRHVSPLLDGGEYSAEMKSPEARPR